MNTTTSNNTNTAGAGIPRGIWIGGSLMALTIIALATTLVVRSNGSTADAATPLAGTVATTDANGAPAGASATAQGPAVVAQQAPATPVREAARPVHRAPVHNRADNERNASRDAGTQNEPQRVASVPVCATCGVIDGYSAVQVQGQTNGVGAVAGGLGGALVGSKIAGRSNHTLGGVIGAVGGGLLGNAIEKHQRTTTVYDVRVRMNDGSIRTVRQSTVPTVGTHVNVDGNTLRGVDGQG